MKSIDSSTLFRDGSDFFRTLSAVEFAESLSTGEFRHFYLWLFFNTNGNSLYSFRQLKSNIEDSNVLIFSYVLRVQALNNSAYPLISKRDTTWNGVINGCGLNKTKVIAYDKKKNKIYRLYGFNQIDLYNFSAYYVLNIWNYKLLPRNANRHIKKQIRSKLYIENYDLDLVFKEYVLVYNREPCKMVEHNR